MGQVFANSQVAHVWASGDQRSGRSNNGNFYFEGRILYSYGSHFAVGVRLNDGRAVLNADSYSISTSGHQSDARSAVSHMETISIPKLTDIARTLAAIADGDGNAAYRKRQIGAVIGYIETHAAELSRETFRYDRDAWPEGMSEADKAERPYMRGTSVPTGETAAETLLRFCGIPKARAAAAIKRGVAKAAKDAKARAAAERKRAKAEAIAVADMTANERDKWLSDRWHVQPLNGQRYNDESSVARMREAAKGLFRLQKTAKAEGLSAKRQNALKAARASLLAIIRAFDEDSAELVAKVRAERLANWRARWNAATTDAEKVAVWSSNGVGPREWPEGSPERAELEAAHEEGKRLYAVAQAEKQREEREAWMRGEGPRYVNFRSPDGTAYVRRSADGERLETSQGADVPWDHAVKAFRFIRLCVERGEGFQTNGRVIRVGHFRVDEITPEGDMRAGCHRFKWADMKALAEREGVFELSPSAEAVETREGVAH